MKDKLIAAWNSVKPYLVAFKNYVWTNKAPVAVGFVLGFLVAWIF